MPPGVQSTGVGAWICTLPEAQYWVQDLVQSQILENLQKPTGAGQKVVEQSALAELVGNLMCFLWPKLQSHCKIPTKRAVPRVCFQQKASTCSNQAPAELDTLVSCPWKPLKSPLRLKRGNFIIIILTFRPHQAAYGTLVPWPVIKPTPPGLQDSLSQVITREVKKEATLG